MHFKKAVLAVAITGLPMSGVHAQVLEEVVITAQKREQNLNDVGLSVTAFSGGQLRDLGLTDTTQLAAYTPGLVYTENGGAPAPAIFAIRGVAQSDFSDHQEGPNAVYVDGAYVSFTSAVGLSMYDVERVEVLRGPQGTLFGRNATGGLLQIVSNKPTDEFESFLSATFAENSTLMTEGAVSGPIADGINARLSFASNNSDGWFENNGPGGKGLEEKNYNLRAQVDFIISDDTNLLLNLRGTKDDKASSGKGDAIAAYESETAGVINQNSPDFDFQEYVDWCDGFFGTTPGSPTQDCFGEQLVSKPFAENTDTGLFDRDYLGGTMTFNTVIGGSINLTSITDFQTLEKLYIEDADKTVLTTGTYDPYQDSEQFSQEVYLSQNEGGFRWQTGLYYLTISGDYTSSFGGDDAGFLSSSDYSLDTLTYAAYAQTEWDLAENLMLLTGFRVTRDEKELDFSGTCVQFFSDPDLGLPCSDEGFFVSENPLQEVQGYQQEIKDTDYAYKVELDWRPSDATLLYGSVTRGNKGGGFSVSVFTDAAPGEVDYDPEVLLSYEIGIKQGLFDGRAQLNATAFYYDYTDHQAQTFDGQAVTIVNVDAEVSGFDLELTSSFGDGWNLLLGFAYLDAIGQDVPLGDGVTADQDLGLAPEIQGNGLIRKTWQTGTGRISAQLQASYVDTRYLSVVNEQVTLIDDYSRTDARVTYESESGDWSAALFVNNVTDDLLNTYKFNEFETNGTATVSYDTPRIWGVTFIKNWQ
jgi:iron complex outermembrane receptor protein